MNRSGQEQSRTRISKYPNNFGRIIRLKSASKIEDDDPGSEGPGDEDPGESVDEDPCDEDPGDEDPGESVDEDPGDEDPGESVYEDPGDEDVEVAEVESEDPKKFKQSPPGAHHFSATGE